MSEPEEEEDFEKLFEASAKAKRFEKGQTIEGTIVTIGGEVALIDVGGKSEAEIDVAELKDDEGISKSPWATAFRRFSQSREG